VIYVKIQGATAGFEPATNRLTAGGNSPPKLFDDPGGLQSKYLIGDI